MDEGIERATAAIKAKTTDLDAAAQQQIAETIGVGAIKYADLSNDRIKDYVFDWNRMLAFDGNTAPYLMYAHARIRSILRKGQVSERPGADPECPAHRGRPRSGRWRCSCSASRRSSSKAGETLQPHRLCGHLYDLATAFTGVLREVPGAEGRRAARRSSRLALCALTARVLAQGLALLGIRAPEQM